MLLYLPKSIQAYSIFIQNITHTHTYRSPTPTHPYVPTYIYIFMCERQQQILYINILEFVFSRYACVGYTRQEKDKSLIVKQSLKSRLGLKIAKKMLKRLN